MSTITTILGTDLITNSRTVINTNFSNLNTDKMETSVLDTDTSLAANSDLKVATQKAVKTYVDAGGNVNASETAKGISEEATDAEVTAGTATGGTGAKLFVTPAKLATTLTSQFGVGFTPKAIVVSTVFETAGRFVDITNSGTNTFNTFGLAMATTATGGRAAGVTMYLVSATNGNVFLGSPLFTASICHTAIGSTGSAFIGLGLVTKSGTGHTYTTDHCGFKILIAAGVSSLYATQGNGSSETASSALTTIAQGTDQVDVMLKINGTASIDYYWRKNGTAWSAATNLTTNLPDTAATTIQLSVSNDSTAVSQNLEVQSVSYSR